MMQLAEKGEIKSAQIKDAAFKWDDPLDLESELTGEERMVRDTAHDYAQEKLFPRVLEAYRHERLRSGDRARDGRARPARLDHSGGIRRRRPRLCRLRADRARARARGFRLPLGDVGAILAGHAPDLCLWQRGAAAQIFAQAGDRRAGRLLRPHRTRPRLRSRLDDNAGGKGGRRLSPQRHENVDHQRAGRRPRRGLGQARRQHPRLYRRARHQGFFHAEDRRQALAARLDHRRDRAR